MSVETAVNGFGRIGMLYGRIAIAHPELELLAINTGSKPDPHDVVDGLRFDTEHGRFAGHEFREELVGITVDEAHIALYGFRNPADAPWRDISDRLVVVESAGEYRKRKDVVGHLEAGAKRVVITSPAENSIPTIVRGVNDTEEAYAAVKDFVSVSSCSTNAIAPVLKAIGDRFKIRRVQADIIHAFTTSQRSLDGRGKNNLERRGHGSVIPATTGSAEEVKRLLPTLPLFRAICTRINERNGSVANLTIALDDSVTAEDVEELLREVATGSHLGVIGISEEEMYLEKVKEQSYSSVIDPSQILVDEDEGTSIVYLRSWFDNEWGYANRVADVALRVGELVA